MKNIIKKLALFVCVLVGAFLASCFGGAKEIKEPEIKDPQTFETVGFYVFQDCNETLCKFWAEIGISVIEFLDISVGYAPESAKMNSYIAEMTDKIATAKKYGIKSYIIFLSNVLPNLSVFDPVADQEKMDNRMREIEYIVKSLPEAAGFILFAGDPGGVGGLSTPGALSLYTDMAREVYALVKKHTPEADFNANIWAVSQFIQSKADPFKADFWISEGELGREIIAMDNFLGTDFGIEIPGHDYYRPLTFRTYRSANKYPASFFPTADDVAAMKEKNVKNIWAFSHFLMDEIDDGDRLTDASHLPNPTTRYIHQYLSKMREIGMNGVIAGQARPFNYLNIFAFARMAQDANLTPEDVLREFAGYLVLEESADTLFEILKFIDNKSTWQMKMPEEEQIPLFETRISSTGVALSLLAQLKAVPVGETAINLFDSPEHYLLMLKARLQAMVK